MGTFIVIIKLTISKGSLSLLVQIHLEKLTEKLINAYSQLHLIYFIKI